MVQQTNMLELAICFIAIIFGLWWCCKRCGDDSWQEKPRNKLPTRSFEATSPVWNHGPSQYEMVPQGKSSKRRRLSPEERLVKELVKKFKGQRPKGISEFSVLLLFSSKEIEDWIEELGTDFTTDNKYPSVPYRDSDLTNYIAARPDRVHAEISILNRLGKLLPLSAKKAEVEQILLYTWLSPCSSCRDKIKTVLVPYTAWYSVDVIYTVDHEFDIGVLRDTGIQVTQVNHYIFEPVP